jgi:hypothetical protein
MSEIKNLKHHLTAAAKHPDKYPNIDLATAVIMLDCQRALKTSHSWAQ